MAWWPLHGILALSRVGYVAAPATPKKLVQLRGVICGRISACLQPDLMDYEGRLAALLCLFLFVERLKETCEAWNGMGVPLSRSTGERRVSKEILLFATVGGAMVCFYAGGRAAQTANRHQSRNYDATKGYPGEDILPV
mgnify:CR=1 FL=1